MTLQTVITKYFECKALVESPRCVSIEANTATETHSKEGKRTTLEDIYVFVCDCELAIKDMGRWGMKLKKAYASLYIYGFNAPINQEHRTLDKIAYHAFKKRGLLSREYHEL